MKTEVRENVLYLAGDVTVKTVTPAAYARFEKQCRLKETAVLDLSGVGRADSACVSLLLAAMRAKPAAPALRGIPAPVDALAGLYEIKEWVNP